MNFANSIIKITIYLMIIFFSSYINLIFFFRYLGSGCTLVDLHYSYRIGHSTLCQIVRNTCWAIWIILQEECCFPSFTEDDWKQISSTFLQQANFPNCLGGIDGKHVRIKPTESGSSYFNYKHYFSVVLRSLIHI